MNLQAEEIRDPRRLLQYLDTFFGIRNNIKGDPKEGVNFTLETLTYMTSRNRADQITEMITEKMKQEGNRIPFGVFDATAGIGGNTMSFLDNPSVQWVVSYEMRTERRDMLKRNLAMYNLAANNRAFVPDGPFIGIPANYKGVVLYFDPPWLPEDIKGHESTKDQYVLHGIKVGDKTLEQWVLESSGAAMVVARVPPGYRLDPIPGYKVESVLLKNSLVLFITPIKPGTPVAPVTPAAPIIKPVVVAPAFVPKPPVPTVIPTNITGAKLPPGVEPHEIEWYNNLKAYLFDLLKMVLPSEEHRMMMISDENMAIWTLCFTDESYNPNVGMNYEELEMVGDHAMEYSFILYLYKTVPGITRSQLSELKSNYISKPYQAQIAQEWGMGRLARTRIGGSIHLYEDLLESFFGGLNLVGDKVFKFGVGNGLCFNMVVKIFENVNIGMESARGKPKTQMKEMFEKLHWGKAVEHFEEGADRSTIATISFTPEAIQMLRGLNVNITSPVLATETGGSKKVASDNAYASALAAVRKMGITDDWVLKMKGNRDNPDLVPYMQQVQKKLESQGYTSFNLKKVKAVKEGKFFQLIGIKPDGIMVVLGTNPAPREEWDGKKELLLGYLSK